MQGWIAELKVMWNNHVEMSSRLWGSQFWAQKKDLRKQKIWLIDLERKRNYNTKH